MQIDWDVPIEMDNGIVLRADVFRPDDDGRHAVILSYGPYAKGLAFQEGYPNQWERMVSEHPDVEAGSSNRYQNWEVVDPEKWSRTGTSACGWTRAGPGARRAGWTRSRRARRATSPRASSGGPHSRGRAARWA